LAYSTSASASSALAPNAERKIASLSDCLAMSCALLIAEVILWTVSLIN
jgi:hypothetical protein